MAARGPDGDSRQDDRLLACLDDLERAAAHVRQAVDMLNDRASGMRAARQQGMSWRQIVEAEERPLIAEMLTATIHEFETTGTRFRQAKARTLHDEGLTMEQIAALFGVSRQRISVLLRASPASPPSPDGHGSGPLSTSSSSSDSGAPEERW